MQYSYMIPLIFSWPKGYDFSLSISGDLIRKRLVGQSGALKVKATFNWNGRIVADDERVFRFDGATTPEIFFEKSANAQDGTDSHGYIEVQFEVGSGDSWFNTKHPPGVYGIYRREGEMSFRSDPNYKFGVPAVILSVAENGIYLDGYPTIHIDRSRDCLESLVLINPYTRPIIVDGKTHDDRKLPRIRVDAHTATRFPLDSLMTGSEVTYSGRLQLTATNRIVTFHMRHDNGEPRAITDHEHLDPYRGDPTHVPASVYAKQKFGKFLKRRFGHGKRK